MRQKLHRALKGGPAAIRSTPSTPRSSRHHNAKGPQRWYLADSLSNSSFIIFQHIFQIWQIFLLLFFNNPIGQVSASV
jgi:hypothetical protein